MNISTKIGQDFVEAFKAKDTFKKDVLGMLKTKITEFEKKTGNPPQDADIISVLQTYVKQLNQTLDAVKGIEDKETATRREIGIVTQYLPKQLDDTEIRALIKGYFEAHGETTNTKAVLGNVMKFFKENYNGQYESKRLKELTEETIAAVV